MNYFHELDSINRIKQSNLDGMECISKFTINEEAVDLFQETKLFTITNGSILCRTDEVVKKFEYSGKLPSEPEFLPNNFLESSDIEKSWGNRIKYEVIQNEYTLLSICSNKKEDQKMKFVNGEEVLRFDYALEGKLTVKFKEKLFNHCY